MSSQGADDSLDCGDLVVLPVVSPLTQVFVLLMAIIKKLNPFIDCSIEKNILQIFQSMLR